MPVVLPNQPADVLLPSQITSRKQLGTMAPVQLQQVRQVLWVLNIFRPSAILLLEAPLKLE